MINNKYYRGQVYYADLGEVNGKERNSEQRGIRPVMIIQNDIGNKYSPTVIVAAISSKIFKKKLPTQVLLDSDYIGLSQESFIMLEQVRTLDKSKLLGYIGKVSEDDMDKIDLAALVSLELKDKVVIEEKARDIEQLDNVLYVAIKTGVQSSEFIENFKREREMAIQDLENYCARRGLDYRSYYKVNLEPTEFKRVG